MKYLIVVFTAFISLSCIQQNEIIEAIVDFEEKSAIQGGYTLTISDLQVISTKKEPEHFPLVMDRLSLAEESYLKTQEINPVLDRMKKALKEMELATNTLLFTLRQTEFYKISEEYQVIQKELETYSKQDSLFQLKILEASKEDSLIKAVTYASYIANCQSFSDTITYLLTEDDMVVRNVYR